MSTTPSDAALALAKPCTAFAGVSRLASGSLVEVTLAVKSAGDPGPGRPILVFDDQTGRVIDLDLRGNSAAIIDRLINHGTSAANAAQESQVPTSSSAENRESRARGRPRLGVIAREVTLLPRHWDWLSSQPGGASVVLRRLVDEARHSGGSKERRRLAIEAAYHFMLAIAGDFAGYEDALRALFADDRVLFEERTARWPADVREYARHLAFDRDGSAVETMA